MWVTNNGGRRSYPIRLEKQVTQSVETSTEIEISNVESNECTIVYKWRTVWNTIGGSWISDQPTYKVRVGVAPYKDSTASNSVFGRHCSQKNLLSEDYVETSMEMSQWASRITKIKNGNKGSDSISGCYSSCRTIGGPTGSKLAQNRPESGSQWINLSESFNKCIRGLFPRNPK